ncbi:MAG: hypothetical protein M3069_25875 [Chloroflexota bacterium]|nr:hypothetical protein [Chloroflexota bacterium]
MSTVAGSPTHIERVLVEVTSLLLVRARIEVEREVEAAHDSSGEGAAAGELRRMRELENELRALRQDLAVMGAVPAPVPLLQVSRFYDVPGQEDA